MIPEIIVRGGESAFSGLFIEWNHSDRCVRAIGGNHTGITSGEIIVVVRLLIDLRTGRISRQRVNAAVLLNKRCIGSAAIARGPPIVVLANSPQQNWRRRRG